MRLKKLMAFVVAFAMVMSIIPSMSLTAFADDSAVAKVLDVEYSSLEEAIAAAQEAYENEPVTVTLMAKSDEDFTVEYGVIELVTDGYDYTGEATVQFAVLITDCEIENIVCIAEGTNEDGTRFGYTGMNVGADMVEGAQVRIGTGADEDGRIAGADSGLRFITKVNLADSLANMAYERYDAEDRAYAEGYEIGVKVQAEGGTEEAFVPATLWQTEGEVFTTALTNLAESNYNRKFKATSYVEVESIRFESDLTVERSIYQVAAKGLVTGKQDEATGTMSQKLIDVLNAYVNQTGVRLTLSDTTADATISAATGSAKGAYTGEAVFNVGETTYRNGVYEVKLEAVGQSVINTRLFNSYVRINNNNSKVAPVTTIKDNGDRTYTVTFDFAEITTSSAVISEAMTLENGDVTAYIPAGVTFTGSATKLSLILKSISAEDSEVEAGEGEELDSFDIHVNGIAEGNTIPVIVTLTEAAEPGLNIGNLALYHVEDGVNVKMEQVDSVEELTKHNQFTYNPVDGTITVALASFSEVALVSETDKAWEGTYDYNWYDKNATELVIANADQLAAFGAIVGGMAEGIDQDSFSGKTVKLVNDINLGDAENNNENLIFYPIGYNNSTGSYEKTSGGSVTSGVNSFEGTFDGNGHTISNFYQNTWEMFGDYNSGYSGTPNHYCDAMGLFGYVVGGTVKNLTVDNFSSDGEYTPTGVIAAYAVNSEFENIAITNCNPRVYNTGNGGIVGIGGSSNDTEDAKLTFTNITIDNTNKITALWGSWDVACGGLVGMFRGAGHAYMTNCHVAAQMDVYNDVCGNYQYYWYRYSGMMIGTNKNMTTDANGYTVPETDKFHAVNCTVHFGDWNDYYYCELVANSLASYTHDHQFSRLEQVDSVDEENMEVTVDGVTTAIPTSGRYNYVVVAVEGEPSTANPSCYHFVDGKVWNHEDAGYEDGIDEDGDGENDLKEDKQIVYLPFNQLFTGYGWGVKHIPVYNGEDYAFEGITILDREVADSVVKFNAVAGVSELVNNKAITIGELFTAVADLEEEVAIQGANVQVTVSPVPDTDSTVEGTYVADTTNWANGTLTLEGFGQATITITDYYFCKPTTITVTVNERQKEVKFANKFTNENFLYRVGNKNAIALGSLFEAVDGVTIDDANVEATVVVIDGNAGLKSTTQSTADWTSEKLQFENTGVVKVTITDNDYCIPTELYLEVVDATNTTTASFSGNTVLLNDVTVSSSLSASGVVYGNGFTVNMENAVINEKNGAVFHLYDGAILKNLSIVGKEFTSVAMNVNDTDYGVSAVRAWGTVVIENCYISGCRAAVSVTGAELTIKDSVIANGVYANIDFRSGILNLHNVTTINEPHAVDGTTIVGLGIVGNMTASAGRELNITGTLTQYNWVSQADCSNIKASGVSSIFNSVFTDDKYASLRYTYNNGTTYVNTGILSLCSDFGASATTGVPSDYTGMDVTATISGVSVDGYVWAPGQAGTLTEDDMKYHDKVYEWTASEQGTSYIPSAFDYSAAGLTAENGVVQIEYESGSSYTLCADTIKALFPATKYGETLSCTVSMNGVDYTDKDIVFDATASQTYTITYTVTDNLVYDNAGKPTETTYEISKELKVFATVVDKGADAPTFTFYYGTNGSASGGTPHTTQPTDIYASAIKQVGEAYYIMPNASATSDNAIGSQTVDNETIYYPIVDGINVRSGTVLDYDFTRYYPVFKAVTINDNGTEYSYSGTTEIPATVSWVSATIDSGNGASGLNDGFGLYNDQYLCKIQTKAGDAESGGTSVVKYSYTALDGNTYYYYVGYRFYDEKESACVTPETLITLADGSHVEVQNLKGDEELLVWNHMTGDFDTAPVGILIDHAGVVADFEVITLTFEDGKSVEIVDEHEFFDRNSMQYVTLDENASDYIGHSFAVMTDGKLTESKLVAVEKEIRRTGVWGLTSYEHITCFTNDVLSSAAYSKKVLNMFEINEATMQYDLEKMEQDIEAYGLYTYADMEDLMPEEWFDLLNFKYLKVAVGKGQITWEDVLEYANNVAKAYEEAEQNK